MKHGISMYIMSAVQECDAQLIPLMHQWWEYTTQNV